MHIVTLKILVLLLSGSIHPAAPVNLPGGGHCLPNGACLRTVQPIHLPGGGHCLPGSCVRTPHA